LEDNYNQTPNQMAKPCVVDSYRISKESFVRVGLVVAVCGLVGLAGCSGGAFSRLNPVEATGGVAGAKLTGSVHGGQQPIVGAQVYLFAAGATGYGGPGIAASASNASVSLLTAGSGTTLDSSGGPTNGDYYVTTDSGGNFTITGDYTCTAGQQVYLYSLGGDSGSGTNAVAGLMAVLGNCPAAGNFATATPFVVINEVSTVAAAYAMAGFASDATHVSSSGTVLAQTGIANAFANAGSLVTLSTGTALATTPSGNGTVPQAEINTLANILAACVNSSGSLVSPAPCYEIEIATATSSFNTAKAAIRIAHAPVSNVAALYALSTATPPFGPALTAQPNDWTISIAYTGGGLSSPNGIAIDGAGNAWVLDMGGTFSVSELSSSGVFLGYFGGGTGIAIDPSGNVWITSDTSVLELSGTTGSLLSGFPGYTGLNSFGGNAVNMPTGIAVDGSGNVWVPNAAGNVGVSEFGNTGSFLGWINGVNFGMSTPEGIAVDASGKAWVPNNTNNSVSVFSSVANSGSGNTIMPGGGLSNPTEIAIDGSGNAWIVSSSSIVKLSNSGTLLSGASGYGTNLKPHSIAIDGEGYVWIANTTTIGPNSNNNLIELTNTGITASSNGYLNLSSSNSLGQVAIDGSGDLWTTLPNTNTVLELIGAATPVVTPLSVGVKNTMLGTRP
jgi:hypothetical protein